MFRSLQMFIAVAEEGNVCRAAARLHISQPALTRRMQALEEEFAVRLFKRVAKGVALTEAGESWLKHALSIRETVERATAEVKRVDKGEMGRLNIGVFGSAMFNIIPQILKRFSRAHPDVELLLHTASRAQQIESLRAGRIQIAFDRFFEEEPDLARELVCKEALLVALPDDHPLARQSAVHFEELRDEPLMGPHDPAGTLAGVRTLFEAYGFEPHIVQRVDSIVTGLTMVACGFGLNIVPASLQILSIPHVTYRPLLADRELFLSLYCVYRKKDSSPLLRALLDTVREYRGTCRYAA